MDTKERVLDGILNKYCCSENIMNLFLEDMGRAPEERADLVKAMGAFCGGLREGLACGALCAAMAALFIAEEDYDRAREDLGPDMMGWFKERFGAWNCAELLEGDESRRMTLCPVIVEETYDKLLDILEDIGVI